MDQALKGEKVLHTRKEVFSKECAKMSSPFSTRFERVVGNCGQHVQINCNVLEISVLFA